MTCEHINEHYFRVTLRPLRLASADVRLVNDKQNTGETDETKSQRETQNRVFIRVLLQTVFFFIVLVVVTLPPSLDVVELNAR